MSTEYRALANKVRQKKNLKRVEVIDSRPERISRRRKQKCERDKKEKERR